MQTYEGYFSFRAVKSTIWHITNSITSADFIPHDCIGDPEFFLSLTLLYTDCWGSHPCWIKQILWCLQTVSHIGYSIHRKYGTFSWSIFEVDRPWINRNWPSGYFLVMNIRAALKSLREKPMKTNKKFSISSLPKSSLHFIVVLSDKEVILSVS